jgi:hypothetical protein
MMADQPRRTPVKLFLVYFLCFGASLALGWMVLSRVAAPAREGQVMLLLLPPLAGMMLFHGLFPLLSRIRLGLEFVVVGGGLVFGLGAILTLAARGALLDPGTALVFWIAGIFGPGWWLLQGYAEKAGYFK